MQTVILKRNGNNDLNTIEFLIKLILFLLCPFLAFLASLLRPSSKSSYVIYVLFGMLFCWSMYFKGDDLDFNNIVLRFYDQHGVTFTDIIDSFLNLFSENSTHKDCYNLLLNWVTFQITSNFHALFLIASIPFLFFYIKSLRLITEDSILFRNNLYGLIILLLFVLPQSIFSVQNFRFSTATWISVFSLLHYFYLQDKRCAYLILITPLVHSSFWFLVILFLSYLIIGKRIRSKLFTIFYFTIPFAFISSDISSIIDVSMLPSIFAKWVESYLSEESVADFGMHSFLSGSGFYFIGIFFTLLRTTMYLLIPILIIRSDKLASVDSGLQRLFYFYIFGFAIINLIQPIPVLGSRFWGIWRIFGIFLWFKIVWPSRIKFLLLLLFSCTHELVYMVLPNYLKIVDSDFFFSNVFSLIAKYWGVNNF